MVCVLAVKLCIKQHIVGVVVPVNASVVVPVSASVVLYIGVVVSACLTLHN